MLNDNELIRYQRHLAISGWDEETQLRLKNASVFVAGAGGLGSIVLYYIAAAGVGKIIFCDRDDVDLSNLNRQILYGSSDIGREKVFAAQERLSALNEQISLIPLKCEISMEISEHLSECDLIIDCLDNFEARHILNRISLAKKIPMIHAGVTEFYSQITLLKPGETACLSCFIPEETTQSGKGIVGAMAGITGSMQALEAIKYLTGSGDLLTNRILFIDMKNISFNIVNLKKNPYCKICSDKTR